MIEELTDNMLADLIEEHEYVAVYFRGDCENSKPSFFQMLKQTLLILSVLSLSVFINRPNGGTKKCSKKVFKGGKR